MHNAPKGFPARIRLILWLLMAPALAAPSAADEKLRYPHRTDIPKWWQQTRAFYCPWDNSGAGSSLMKYKIDHKGDFKTFDDLDLVLADARRLGTDVIYLVGYWEPEYVRKSDYRPMAKWGGDEAFRRGVEEVHKLGGRVICYLEALIIHRDTELGRTVGRDWAMWDEKGNPYPYYGRHEYYLMYPGEGSGWTDYIVEVAARLAREYRIDGVHLDSYGVHLDQVLPDYNPRHPHGKDTDAFHPAAVELVRRMREEMRKHVPHAVVILEGAERTDLLDVCDGAQFENLEKLRRKPWFEQRKYPIFTSSFSLETMKQILDEDYNLALSPWWFKSKPRGRDEKALRRKTDKKNRFDQLMALHLYHNILRANDLLPSPAADFDRLHAGIIEELNEKGWDNEFEYGPLRLFARRYMERYERFQDRITCTPADAIRDMLVEVKKKPRLPG